MGDYEIYYEEKMSVGDNAENRAEPYAIEVFFNKTKKFYFWVCKDQPEDHALEP